jgi:hypothetical protein
MTEQLHALAAVLFPDREWIVGSRVHWNGHTVTDFCLFWRGGVGSGVERYIGGTPEEVEDGMRALASAYASVAETSEPTSATVDAPNWCADVLGV